MSRIFQPAPRTDNSHLAAAALVFALAVVIFLPGLAAGAEMIASEGLTTEAIMSALEAAEITVSQDEDGDARVVIDERVFWMRGNQKQNTIYLLAVRSFVNQTPLGKKLLLANSINNGLVVIRAYMNTKGDRLFLDLAFPTEAGISDRQIVNLAERFAKLLTAAYSKDVDRILR